MRKTPPGLAPSGVYSMFRKQIGRDATARPPGA